MPTITSLERAPRAKRTFERFKELCPHSIEIFSDWTDDDVERWKYHIKQAENAAMFPVIDEANEIKPARQLADSRRFETWEQMPPYMQHNYLKIADYWCGEQCYAVGSRVNGDYVELWGDRYVRRMREILGKTDKSESDYDYCVDVEKDKYCICGPSEDVNVKKTYGLSANIVMHLPPGEHKIKIPMWDFSKLPADKKQEAKEMFAAQQWGKLMQLHNDYELSQNHYCCDETPIIRWFKWAIDNGKLD